MTKPMSTEGISLPAPKILVFSISLMMIALIAKDTIPFGDRFIMRSLGAGIALSYGLWWMLSYPRTVFRKEHILICFYLCVLMLSAVGALFPGWVLLQIGALTAVTLVGIAAGGFQKNTDTDIVIERINQCLLIILLIVGTLNLVSIWLWPANAFAIGDIAGGKRFTGLYGRPAMVSASMGILFGVAVFGVRNKTVIWSIIRIIAAFTAIACLLLASARTFWIAFVAACFLTTYRYARHRVLITVISLGVATVFVALIMATGRNLNTDTLGKSLRRDFNAVSTIEGRMEIWRGAIKKAMERPFFGYGFTIGVTAFAMPDAKFRETPQYILKNKIDFDDSFATMHNGYIQAVIDTGFIGAFFYIALITTALYRVLRYDKKRRLACGLFILIFLGVANLGESVIFSASVFHSTIYWFWISYSLGISKENVVAFKTVTQVN
jgi:O-antigen ligase